MASRYPPEPMLDSVEVPMDIWMKLAGCQPIVGTEPEKKKSKGIVRRSESLPLGGRRKMVVSRPTLVGSSPSLLRKAASESFLDQMDKAEAPAAAAAPPPVVETVEKKKKKGRLHRGWRKVKKFFIRRSRRGRRSQTQAAEEERSERSSSGEAAEPVGAEHDQVPEQDQVPTSTFEDGYPDWYPVYFPSEMDLPA